MTTKGKKSGKVETEVQNLIEGNQMALVNQNESEIFNILTELSKEAAKVEALINRPAKTSGVLRLENGMVVEILKETNVERLIMAAGHLCLEEKKYQEGINVLDLGKTKVPVPKIGGFSAHDWIEDIKQRVGLVKAEARVKKLQEAHGELTKHLSAEQRQAIAIQKAKNLLNDED